MMITPSQFSPSSISQIPVAPHAITKVVLALLIASSFTLFVLGATNVYDLPALKWTMLATSMFFTLTLFFYSLCQEPLEPSLPPMRRVPPPQLTTTQPNTPLPGFQRGT